MITNTKSFKTKNSISKGFHIKRWLYFLICTTLLSISCGKSDVQRPPILQNKKENNVPLTVSNKSIMSQSEYEYKPITGILTPSMTSLKTIIENNNIAEAQSIIDKQAQSIMDYNSIVYGIDLAAEFENDKTNIILFGLFQAAKEKYLNISGDNSSADKNMNCFLSAVGAIIGIPDAVGLYGDFMSGKISTKTLISALKMLGKRVATVINIAVAVYNVGVCLDWWGTPMPPTEPISDTITVASIWNSPIPIPGSLVFTYSFEQYNNYISELNAWVIQMNYTHPNMFPSLRDNLDLIRLIILYTNSSEFKSVLLDQLARQPEFINQLKYYIYAVYPPM